MEITLVLIDESDHAHFITLSFCLKIRKDIRREASVLGNLFIFQ